MLFGLPERIRTAGLQSRSLTRYPAVPRADIKTHYILPHFCKKVKSITKLFCPQDGFFATKGQIIRQTECVVKKISKNLKNFENKC